MRAGSLNLGGDDINILRIFPGKQNQYTPTDQLAYCMTYKEQAPMLNMFSKFKEIHISCCFSWDRIYCENLKYQLEGYTKKPILLGGPAFGSEAHDFVQGLYIKSNIIFTSRGCNNACPWCIVPKIEGNLKHLPICQGNIVQDNNFLQTNKSHKDKVFNMLRTQRQTAIASWNRRTSQDDTNDTDECNYGYGG